MVTDTRFANRLSLTGASSLLAISVVLLLAGCGGGARKTDEPNRPTRPALDTGAVEEPEGKPPEAAEVASSAPSDSEAEPKPARKKFQAIELGGGDGGSGTEAGSTEDAAESALSREQQIAAVVEQLQPFQVLLGQWTWTTKKKFDGFAKHAEDLKWVWDFRTDIRRPALVFNSTEHPYFSKGILTYLPESKQYRLTTTGVEGDTRVLVGTWTDGGEPKEEHDGKVVQRSYKLELLQTEPVEGDQWKVVMQLLDNDQLLTDVTRRAPAGKNYSPVDVVRQQRFGTSFAVAESDNPGPKCIVSGGLGTMTVSYKGQTYPVCCTGCVAAFEEDPERWLAKMMKK
jgi:hypothetical protein